MQSSYLLLCTKIDKSYEKIASYNEIIRIHSGSFFMVFVGSHSPRIYSLNETILEISFNFTRGEN